MLEHDLEIVSKILHQRLQSDDITGILSRLSAQDQNSFTEKVGRVLCQTSALLEVSRQLTEDLALDIMLPKLVDLISSFLNAERVTIFLHDERAGELFSVVAQGDLTFNIRIPSHLGLAGASFSGNESLLVNDPYDDPRFDPETDRKSGFVTREVLCVPLRKSDRPIGVIQALNCMEESFTQSELLTLEAIAQHASVGFENARLYDQMSRAREKEQRLLDMTTEFSKELQLKPLLIKIMEVVTSFLDADRSTLFLYDHRTKELWSQVAQGTSEIRFAAHLGIAGSAFTNDEVVNIEDAYTDNRFNSDVDRKTGYLTRTILCMPVKSKGGGMIGVIQVINKHEGTFTSEDERSLRAFAAQASIAIENAQLFEKVMEVKRYNETVLEAMTDAVLTLGVSGQLVTANRAAAKLFGGQAVIDQLCHHSEEVGKRTFEELCKDDLPWLAQLIHRAREDQAPAQSLDHPLELHDLHASLGIMTAEECIRSVNVTVVPLEQASMHSKRKENHVGRRGFVDEHGLLLILEDMSAEKRLRGTMSRYLPSEVADQLLREEEGVLGGNLQKATILFSDIRGFTTISEEIGPQETVRLLNDYFGVMVDLISDHHGILDKFIGDAIMAVFGAPFPSPDDADNALSTAVDMLRALDTLNATRSARGEPSLSIGIGLNTGEVLSGNIGSSKRMDYTVIGDAVNLAARLESATKGFGAELLVSEFTLDDIRHSHPMREVDLMRVKGKFEPVRVYEVLTHKLERNPSLAEQFAHYEEGLSRYRRGEWSSALTAFLKAAKGRIPDPLSLHYIERCQHFMAHPPPSSWDGVWVMQTK